MRHMNVLIGDMGGDSPVSGKAGMLWETVGWVGGGSPEKDGTACYNYIFVSNDRNEDVVDKTHGGKKNDEQKERDDGTRSSHTVVAKR